MSTADYIKYSAKNLAPETLEREVIHLQKCSGLSLGME